MSKGACHCVYGDASSECQKIIFTTHVQHNLTVAVLRDDVYVSRQPLRAETYECVSVAYKVFVHRAVGPLLGTCSGFPNWVLLLRKEGVGRK